MKEGYKSNSGRDFNIQRTQLGPETLGIYNYRLNLVRLMSVGPKV